MSKRITITKQVLDYLVMIDDFATYAQIKAALRLTAGQLGITLSDLKRHHAVDAVEVEGVPYWFATPDRDSRHHKVEEIVDGIKRQRRPRQWLLRGPSGGFVKSPEVVVNGVVEFVADAERAAEFTIMRAKALQTQHPQLHLSLVRKP